MRNLDEIFRETQYKNKIISLMTRAELIKAINLEEYHCQRLLTYTKKELQTILIKRKIEKSS